MNFDKITLESHKACGISLTYQGNNLLLRLKNKVKSKNNELDLYTLKNKKTPGFNYIADLDLFFQEAFQQYDTIIAVMATGIVIRKIATLLKSKVEDPGIIIIDLKGENVISLLSGHIGNANQNSKILAETLNANCVITTASDQLNFPSIDELAKSLNLILKDLTKAKEITSLILENKRIALLNDSNKYLKKSNFSKLFIIKTLEEINNFDGGILITDKKISDIKKPFIQLFPHQLIIGIGTKKNINENTIIKLINEIIQKNGYDINGLDKIVSISHKKNEIGIIKAAEFFNVPFFTYNNEQIRKVEHLFKGSTFVKKTVGVGAVNEPSGYLGSNKGIQIGKTIKKEGVSLSLWKMK